MKDENQKRQVLKQDYQKNVWEIETGNKGFPIKNRPLTELLATMKERHGKGEAPGFIRHMEIELEIQLIELEKLWAELGLPI